MNMSDIFPVVGIAIKQNWLNYDIGSRTQRLNTATVKSCYWTWSWVSVNHFPISQSFSWRSTLMFHPSWSSNWLLIKRFLYQNLCITWLSIWTRSLAHHTLPSFTIVTLPCGLYKSQSFFLCNMLIFHLISLSSWALYYEMLGVYVLSFHLFKHIKEHGTEL